MKIPSVGGEFFQQPSGDQHVVAEGETTKTIANFHDVSVDSLKAANPGLSDFPAVGQSLFIPAKKAEQSLISGQLQSDSAEAGSQINAFSDALQNAGKAIQQFTLTADLFSFNSDGHLLVKDQDLTNHFRQHLETQTPAEARAVIVMGGKTALEAADDQAGLENKPAADTRAIIIDGGEPEQTATPLTDELQIGRNGFEVHDDGTLLIKDQVVSDAFRTLSNAGVTDSKAIIVIC